MGAISSTTKITSISDLITDLKNRKNLTADDIATLSALGIDLADDDDDGEAVTPTTKRTKRSTKRNVTKSTKNGGEKTTNQSRYACSPKGHDADLHEQYVDHIAANCPKDRLDAKRDLGNAGSYFFAPTLQSACLLRFGSYADGSDRPSKKALSPGSDKFVMNDGLFGVAEEAGLVE